MQFRQFRHQAVLADDLTIALLIADQFRVGELPLEHMQLLIDILQIRKHRRTVEKTGNPS